MSALSLHIGSAFISADQNAVVVWARPDLDSSEIPL
jgi:hypothetical protein